MTFDQVPAGRVRKLTAYDTPSHPAPIELDLSGNIGPSPPPAIRTALANVDEDTLRTYPDLSSLRQAIAERHDISPDRVLVTAGGDQAIDVVFRAYLEPGRTLLHHEPTFAMIEQFGRLTGADIASVPWFASEFPTEAMREIAADATVTTLVSPNNPTGRIVPESAMGTLADAAAPGLVLVDHAYVEFAEADLTEPALERDNVAVVRSFSKALGLAGARVGYLLGPPALIETCRKVRSPYPISGPAIAVAQARLRCDSGDVSDYIHEIKVGRNEVRATLKDIEVTTHPSAANFVLAQVPDAIWAFDALAGLGIKVRRFTSTERLEDAIRISIPAEEANRDRLRAALRTALAPEAILFDMDGVLADVHESYRRAIIETAATFDVELSHEEINQAKRAGDANDDWELTHRLLTDRGVDVSFDEVKRTFEAIYLGDDSAQEPLYRHDRLLINPESIRAISRKYNLGVVTGRPQRDATRFLERFDLVDDIDAPICGEDAPAKPDPAPVTEALDRLGSESGWLLGDTPDDIEAARAAGIVPIGIVPPHADQTSTRDALHRTGASRVLDTPDELLGLLDGLP